MAETTELKDSLLRLKETFNREGNNSDITKHEIRKGISSLTNNKDYSNKRITERRIED